MTLPVLEWGEEPKDLDSHLFGPTSSGGMFEVYYRRMNYMENNTLIANLDVDDVSSYGPETTTLYAPIKGDYYFSVYNYSNDPEINFSKATVKVYTGNKTEPAYVFTIPNTKTDKNWWRVFKYDSAKRKVVKIDEFANTGM